MTNILSVNFNHDGAGTILSNGRIAGFVTTERFSRKKKHPGLRAPDLTELLAQAGLSIADIDHVILCNLHNMDSREIPLTHGTNLKETWLPFEVNRAAGTVVIGGREIGCTVNPKHHLLHCALAYFTSPFESAAVFSADPVGWGAYLGRDNRLQRLDAAELTFSANMAYTLVARRLFGSGIFGAGKVMGLAPYGKPARDDTDYRRIDTMEALYELSARDPVTITEGARSWNASLAYHVQRGLEVQLTDALRVLHEKAAQARVAPHVCLSGGTALNSVANQIAFKASSFERLHLHPACGDDGTALGAALWYWHDQLNQPRRTYTANELMYSVRTYDDQVDRALDSYGSRLRVDRTEDYCALTAELIADGKIVGWFQGASEIGPRALGNRSILADPRRPDMKDRLNCKVKFRESFRPFAPAVLDAHAQEWFGLDDSPFMLRVAPVLKDGIPAVTHVDGTARLQPVTRTDNKAFYDLIESFHQLTGVPIVLNTSFNLAGEPIVETPEDAIESFLRTSMDRLVFRGRVVRAA